jgi:HEAT repeat protein
LPLIELLQDGNTDVRDAAARGLGLIGRPAEPAVDALVRATHERGTAREAARALGRIGRAPDRCVPVLIRVSKDPDVFTRVAAVEALGMFGRDAKDALPALNGLLKESDAVRKAAADAIRRIQEQP